MKHIFILLLALCLLLAGCAPATPPVDNTAESSSSTAETENTTEQAGSPVTGWVTEDTQTFYVTEEGSRHTGWLDLNGNRYYLDENGVLQTGWLDYDGQTYYLQADGSAARGKVTVGSRVHYFTSAGAKVLVVNPWNFIPTGYAPDLVDAEDGYIVDRACRDALMQMLKDCRAAGYNARITSAYRRHTTQIELYNNKVYYFLDLGYDEATARTEAAKIIAVPGTSEHEMGLAVDLVDNGYWVLDEAQERTPAQKWLMEHCWEYGFILRYPNGKSEYTGIIYEPWHYRYVGKALALELQKTGQCLEEYLAALTK